MYVFCPIHLYIIFHTKREVEFMISNLFSYISHNQIFTTTTVNEKINENGFHISDVFLFAIHHLALAVG